MSKTAETTQALLPTHSNRMHLQCGSFQSRLGREKITACANSRLKFHPQLHGNGCWVKCHFADGLLYLSGRLPSWYLKQVAQEAVRDVDGVSGIVNEILVSDSLAN